MTSAAKSAATLITLALLSQFSAYPLKSFRNGASEHEGETCLLYLYKAICAAIDAGIMTRAEGMQLFEKAHERIANRGEAALETIRMPQQSAYISIGWL
jgi:hypothetical protein